MSQVYQQVGVLASTVYITRQGVGPRGNFVSDGTNTREVLEAAMTYMSVLGGGEGVIGAGDFGDFDQKAVVQDHYVSFRGMGYSTYLHCDSDHVWSNTGKDYFSLKDMRIAQLGSGGTYHCVFVEDGADNLRLEGVWITDSDSHGIRFEGTNIYYVWIIECYFTSTDADGINADMDGGNHVFYLIVKGNILLSTGTVGVNAQECDRSIISGNILVTTGGVGVEVDTSDYCLVENNIIYDSGGSGVSLSASSPSAVLQGNVVFSPNGDGVFVNTSNYCLVANNLLYDPTDDGVEFDDSDYCLCKGNTVYSAGDDGIIFGAGTTRNMFTCVGNNIISSAGKGVIITNTLNRGLINSNFIYDPTEDGINLSAMTTGQVKGNIVYSSGGNGVALGSGVYLLISNYLISNTGDGVNLTGGDNCFITFNYSISNSQYGLEIDSDADSNVVYGNYTRGNSSGCVNIANANCDDNILWTNSFDEGNITDAGTGTCAFDNFDPSANNWIASIAAPAGGR